MARRKQEGETRNPKLEPRAASRESRGQSQWRKWREFIVDFAKRDWEFAKRFWNLLKKTDFGALKRGFGRLGGAVFSKWYIAALLSFSVLFLYYPIGAYLIHSVDTAENPPVAAEPGASKSVAAMKYLVNREVNDHLWTPNLPFFFPSYILDNMPNFQLGEMSAVAAFSQAFAQQADVKKSTGFTGALAEAAELLQYPGTVWVFGGDGGLAPSSNSRYRKALKKLRQHNESLAEKTALFSPNADDFRAVVRRVSFELGRTAGELEAYVRETSGNWVDLRRDNAFFYHKGRLYAYLILLKGFGEDYQSAIVDAGLYEDWVHLLNSLAMAARLDPLIVRNAEVSSPFAPNHLVYLSFYALRAQNAALKMLGGR